MKTVIEMALETGWKSYAGPVNAVYSFNESDLIKFAELVRADQTKRADALAATIAALRDIVTSEAESKSDFIARVRELLGVDPDQRVLSAVLAEREACAKVCYELPWKDMGSIPSNLAFAAAIRARSNT